MRLIVLTLVLVLLPVSASQAATSVLYTGEAAVVSQQESERKKALPSALRQVLQKLSGLREIDDYPALQETLAEASSILVSFQYRNTEILLSDGSVVNELRLVANFSKRGVDEIMKALQLPLWEPQRQAIEVWVLVDDGVDRRILPVEFTYAWRAMGEVAAARGLPLVWPRADESGTYPVDEQLLWGGYTEELVARGSSSTMVAAARREGPQWNVRFNLSYGDQNWTWRSQDIDLQRVLESSIQQAADNVALANTIAAADQVSQVTEFTVGGIRNAADYASCLTYLQKLSVVERVSVVSARAGQVTFRLELNALPRYLENAAISGGMFEFIESENRYLLKN